MKNETQNISIDVNIPEVLGQIETEYLLSELSNRSLFYFDITSLISDTLDYEDLKILKKEISKMIKDK